MNEEKFHWIIKETGGLLFAGCLWLVTILIVAFTSDYPFSPESQWFLNLAYYLVMLFPAIFIVSRIFRTRFPELKEKKYSLLVRYFHLIYLAIVVGGTLAVSELVR